MTSDAMGRLAGDPYLRARYHRPLVSLSLTDSPLRSSGAKRVALYKRVINKTLDADHSLLTLDGTTWRLPN